MIKKSWKFKKLPPGQRLIWYILFASFIIIAASYLNKTELPPTASAEATKPTIISSPFTLANDLEVLASALNHLSDKPRLRTGVFVVNPKDGNYVDIHAHDSFSAASLIKLPVLVSLMRAIDNKEVSLDKVLTLREDLIAGGSGYLQWQPKGSKIPLNQAAELMIIYSDNTATNLIIDLLGGPEILNRHFTDWGLAETRIRNMLPDFDGTNTTSPYDLAYLLGRIDKGELVSSSSRDFMYKIMSKTRTRTLIPPGLGPGSKIIHKTGDIGSMVGDAGIVTAPSGLRYIIAVQVERPHNDRRANELIRNLSKQIYMTYVPGSLDIKPTAPVRQRVTSHKKRHHHRKH